MSQAFLSVAAVGALSFGVVVPAAASTHKVTVRVSAHAEVRTVLVGRQVVLRGVVTPAAAGPIVLERLVNQDWAVLSRAKTAATGAYSFSVASAHRGGTWLLRVVRPATTKAKEGDSATVRVEVVPTAFKLTVSLEETALYVGDRAHLLGTVTPSPGGGVLLQRLDSTGWHTLSSEPVGSNGGFSGYVSLPVGDWSLRAVQVPSATVAGGESAAVIASVYPDPTLS